MHFFKIELMVSVWACDNGIASRSAPTFWMVTYEWVCSFRLDALFGNGWLWV